MISTKEVFNFAMKIFDYSAKNTLTSGYLSEAGFSLALRLLIEPNLFPDIKIRDELLEYLLTKIQDSSPQQFMINSLAIMYFEKDVQVQQQIEKYCQRSLYAKFEHDEKAASINIPEPGEIEGSGQKMTQVGFNNFLQYF